MAKRPNFEPWESAREWVVNIRASISVAVAIKAAKSAPVPMITSLKNPSAAKNE
jgi:hypothetical protein